MTSSPGRASWPAVAIVVVAAALAPLVFTEFFLSVILTKSLWLGIAAASLIFLSAYGGMVSLAQVGIYGVAGMTFANLVMADGGAAAAWSPWLAVIAALLVATAVGLGFGAIAARSVGIYFLMITLAFSVLVYYFFSQVTQLSGFGGVNNVELPALLNSDKSDCKIDRHSFDRAQQGFTKLLTHCNADCRTCKQAPSNVRNKHSDLRHDAERGSDTTGQRAAKSTGYDTEKSSAQVASCREESLHQATPECIRPPLESGNEVQHEADKLEQLLPKAEATRIDICERIVPCVGIPVESLCAFRELHRRIG